MSFEDEAAKLNTRPSANAEGAKAADFYADFFNRLTDRGFSNEQAFTLTHEHMVLDMTSEVVDDDD